MAVTVELTAFCKINFTIQLRAKITLNGLDTLRTLEITSFMYEKHRIYMLNIFLGKIGSCYHRNCNYLTSTD